MFTLKSPEAHDLNNLRMAMNKVLSASNVNAVDRRALTAVIIGRIAGSSLPVQDIGSSEITAANVWRDSYLTTVKMWLGRIVEAFPLDIDAALFTTYTYWLNRSHVAFPRQPGFDLLASPLVDRGCTVPPLYKTITQRYTICDIAFERLASYLVIKV